MSDISLGKRRQSKFGRKAIWTVLLLGIVLAFGYWLTRETPSPTDSSTTRLQSFTLSPKPQRTTRPVLVDSHNGTIIFPIEFPTERSHYDPEFVNIAIFDKTEQTSKYLFPKNGSIRWFAARRAANNGTIAIIASTEDTNSDGRIDDEDIHQLYWLNPRTMGLTKLDTPLLNFAERVPVALEFRAADDVSLAGNDVYKVTIDTNSNGRVDRQDPIQFVMVDAKTQKVTPLLPTPSIIVSGIDQKPTRNIETNELPKKKKKKAVQAETNKVQETETPPASPEPPKQ